MVIPRSAGSRISRLSLLSCFLSISISLLASETPDAVDSSCAAVMVGESFGVGSLLDAANFCPVLATRLETELVALPVEPAPIGVTAPASSLQHNFLAREEGGERVVLGVRRLLNEINDHGISFQGIFVNDWSKDLQDHFASTSGFGRLSFDLVTTIDGKKLFGLPGSAAVARLKQHTREFGMSSDGAAQVYSNIDAPSKTILYELWLEQRLWSDRLRFKGGKIDANTEFATVQNASVFLNSSMGFSPTIMAFPTYPSPKLAFTAYLKSVAHGSVGFGIFQTEGMGRLTVIEPGKTWTTPSELPGRISVGYWRLDGRVDHFDGSSYNSTQGYYSVLEQALWRKDLGSGNERRLSAFFQFGEADDNVSLLTNHVGGGLTLQAPSGRRSKDSVGIAFTRVAFTSAPEQGVHSPELVLEAYYKFAITKHLALVQDFQYLHHPGGLSSNRDCPIVTPRLVVSF